MAPDTVSAALAVPGALLASAGAEEEAVEEDAMEEASISIEALEGPAEEDARANSSRSFLALVRSKANGACLNNDSKALRAAK